MRRTVTLTCLLIGLIGVPNAARAATPESQVAEMINQERAQRGYRALILRDDLSQIAERHSKRMQQRGEIYHNKNLGDEIPGSWEAAGENVGVGGDIYMLHEAFMASPQHRANMLGGYTEIGVGVVVDESGETYVTQVFVRRARSSPSSSSSSSSSSPSSGSSRSGSHGGGSDPADSSAGGAQRSKGDTSKKSDADHRREPAPAETSSPKESSENKADGKPAERPSRAEPTAAEEPEGSDTSVPSRAVGLLLRVVSFR